MSRFMLNLRVADMSYDHFGAPDNADELSVFWAQQLDLNDAGTLINMGASIEFATPRSVSSDEDDPESPPVSDTIGVEGVP